jgi:hypothetical protein
MVVSLPKIRPNLEKIKIRYEFGWERFKFSGFQGLIMFLGILLIIAAFFAFFISYLAKGPVATEVLVLVVLGVQTVFMFLQTYYYKSQIQLLKLEDVPQLLPVIEYISDTNVINLYVKNNRLNEAHNVRYGIEIFNPKRDVLKYDSIGIVTKDDKILLTQIEKNNFKNKMIISFFYEDIMTFYMSKYMKKHDRDNFLLIGFS